MLARRPWVGRLASRHPSRLASRSQYCYWREASQCASIVSVVQHKLAKLALARSARANLQAKCRKLANTGSLPKNIFLGGLPRQEQEIPGPSRAHRDRKRAFGALWRRGLALSVIRAFGTDKQTALCVVGQLP